MVTRDGLWWLFILAGLQLHFPKYHSPHGCGLGWASKSFSTRFRRQKWSSSQVKNINIKSGVTAVLTQSWLFRLTFIGMGQRLGPKLFQLLSDLHLCSSRLYRGKCVCSSMMRCPTPTAGHLHHQGCRCETSESYEGSSSGSYIPIHFYKF